MGLLDQYQIGGPSLFNAVDTPFGGQGAQPEKRGGFLGSGYNGEDIMSMLLRAAAIAQGDLGAGAHFGQNIGAKARAEAEAAAQERQRQIERQEGLQDWQFKRDNPAAPRDETYEVIKAQLGPEAANEYLRSKGDPTITTTLPGDRFYSGSRSGLAAALGGVTGGGRPKSAPPAEAIADLKRDPASAAEFDEIFGIGASKQYLGGGASNGTGGFRY